MLSFLLISCVKENSNLPNSVGIVETDYKLESAIAELYSMMDVIASHDTKSLHSKTISKVTTLTSSDFYFLNNQTKSVKEDSDIVYIVDFNEGGCAVLGADDRLKPVILILENGTIDPMTITSIIPTPIGNSLFDYYNEEMQEYYIGNKENILGSSNIISLYIERMLTHPSSVDDENYTYQLSIDAVPPILNTRWHQGSPYNNKMPLLITMTRRPMGCTTLALLQILVANKDIPISAFGVTESTWEDLDVVGIYDSDDSPENLQLIDDVSTIARRLADGIDVFYNFLFSGGTFATPKQVCNYMKEIGYEYADVVMGFSLSSILNMLQLNKPVFIAALNGGFNGHAWVIDGYVNRIATHNVTGERTEQLLLHCNWGWAGLDDGYYIPELFDSDGFVIPDYPTYIGDDPGFNASWWYRQIVY